tara:strand:+ start:492 stop:725 length:234 start_codon:yes stop_codon:yes gene_type:complete
MNNELPVIGEELLDKFIVGDLVSWRKLIEDKTGIILKVFTKESGDREFPCAEVYIMGEDVRTEILLTNLTNVSKTRN